MVSILPKTPQTENILNADLFTRMPKGASLINAGRGDQLVEEDLLSALDSGHVSQATLDVFRTEPLPADHPYWTHPKITVTPHSGGDPFPDTAAKADIGQTCLEAAAMAGTSYQPMGCVF